MCARGNKMRAHRINMRPRGSTMRARVNKLRTPGSHMRAHGNKGRAHGSGMRAGKAPRRPVPDKSSFSSAQGPFPAESPFISRHFGPSSHMLLRRSILTSLRPMKTPISYTLEPFSPNFISPREKIAKKCIFFSQIAWRDEKRRRFALTEF